jgi:hypothetical protein
VINLGSKYRDKASGFVGVATGRAEYLDDSPGVRLTAETGAGTKMEDVWFPEGRCEPYREKQSHGFEPPPKPQGKSKSDASNTLGGE